MSFKLIVLIYGLCPHFNLQKNFKKPVNALEVHAIQTVASKCKAKYDSCLKYAKVKRYKIGGSHVSGICK